MRKLLLMLFAVLTAGVAFGQTNLLTNPSFEEWSEDYPTGWKSTSSASSSATVYKSEDAKTGTYAVEIKSVASSNKRMASKEITLKPGTYEFSVFLKNAGTDAIAKIGYVSVEGGKTKTYVYPKGGEEDKEIEIAVGSTYEKYTFSFTLEQKTTVCMVVMNNKKSDGASIIADDASLTTTDGGIDESDEDTPQPAGVITVAEAQALNGGNATVHAAVYAVSKNGAVLGDETGFIYYYKSGLADLAVGDVINITGDISKYGGFNQFPAASTVEKAGTATITYPEVTVLDGAGLDAWYAEPAIQYVKVSGTLTISGNYYNLNVEGAQTAIGSLVAPTEAMTTGLVNNSEVTVTGFAMYTSGGKYVNIVCTNIKIDQGGETKDITNTPETAYTTSQAKAIVDEGLGLEQSVYVKGTVVEENLSIAVDYGNANYYITDGTYELYVYRGNYIENTKFSAEDQLKAGDEVIIYGKLQNYKKTDAETGAVTEIPEFTQGNYIYSLNGVTDGIRNIEVVKSSAIFDLSGRRVAKAQKGIYIVNGKKVIF